MAKSTFQVCKLPMRLLLVEDDPMIGKSVQQGLKLEGYTVDWARDGERWVFEQ